MDKSSVSRFWEENYSVVEKTKDLKRPTPEEVHADFIQSTGKTHIDLETFKVLTGSLGKGIKLNKRRRKNQPRFYNVTAKRQKLEQENHSYVHDPDSTQLDSQHSVEEHNENTGDNCPTEKYELLDTDSTQLDGQHSVKEHNENTDDNCLTEKYELLDKYLKHQESMDMTAKTSSALRAKHKAPSSRKQMFDILKGKGFYKKFPISKFSDFKAWLDSPSGGQLRCSEEIISEISRFLYFCNPRKVKWKKMLDTKSFNNYLIATKDAGLGPDGLKTKIERAKTGLKFLAYKKPSLHDKCNRVSDEYSQWLKPLVKQKKILRMKNSWRNELCGLNLTMDDIDNAVSNEIIDKFIEIMRKAMNGQKLTQQEYRVIVDTLITLTITQESAIRPGAFQFMTLEELDNPVTYISTTDGTVYNIVFVLTHKTFSTHGPLAVPFPESAWIQLHNYLKYVRPQVNPQAPHQQLVFLNARGNMISKPGKSIVKVTKKHEKHITATKIRHCVATAGNDVLTDTERRAVARGIGHTMEVHDKVYTDRTIKTVKSSIEAQKKLHNKSKQNTL